MSKRDDIMVELVSRLRTLDPTPAAIIEGDGGIWGSWGRHIPAVHIFENPSDDELVKRGMYQITLPVQIEYIIKLSSQNKLYSEGRARLNQLVTAIEQDERFYSDLAAKELVIEYKRTASEIADVMDGIIGVGVIYEFTYAEKFLGYECYRPNKPGNGIPRL